MEIDEGKTGDVNVVLLCRHKTQFGDDGDATFDDVAMIMHNKSNGRTCWFQAPDGDRVLDGTKVLYPHKDTKAAAGVPGNRKHEFWLTPATTATVKCVGCHDNGPWMNSYWMRQAAVVPDDNFKYAIPGKAFKDASWKLKFIKKVSVDPGKDAMGQQQRKCTSCHRLSVRETVASLGQGTCKRWLHWTTRGGPAHNDFPPTSSKYGQTWAVAGWMPVRSPGDLKDASGNDTQAIWDSAYGAYVTKLIECCEDTSKCDETETACAPIGGGGCLPPTRATEICEAKLAAATDKLLRGIIKCHRTLAQQTIVDDEACEATEKTRFDQGVAKLKGCPPCALANLTTIKAQAESVLDANAYLIYCAGTTPLGGDDTGYIPPPANAACAHSTTTATAKLVARVIKCRRLRARGKLTEDADLAICEAEAAAQFDLETGTLSACPLCLDFALIKSTFGSIVDAHTDLAFCESSPSGAFLDGPF